ncbi:cysteine--tRNA ligase [Maritalea porphyrae]|uniref:Cysteine--tRNA ligase n=1 Tax=Maritalea porphyrae TaxID=880732 RepID=A0ABQ5UTN7_9HYPH|nr:cysteine--tRNA ligase [Maritalea porphyrae]GLQ18085.1 cysteine--tRNA ligase [Maritalea porphyrae]
MTEIQLYNTLTRTKEQFVPIDASNVRMYVCGPTVYDYAHIGNARPVIVFDVLYRLLRHVYGTEHVVYVRNITDVDDKINARAVKEHPGMELNAAIREVTERTANQYRKDMLALGNLDPTIEPRATDNIAEMITLIETLIEKGHAYQAGGEVLFDVTSMPDYGQLSNRNLDDMQAGARVEVEAHKKSPGDFVLWKLSDENQPGWDSPWGRGRPGWHIECSAMSERYIGKHFDIHGGGIDLVFPHHENEIAQSRCAHGSSHMANVWMHNGFLQIEGEKMSKSLGNFYTIADLLETDKFGGRVWPGDVLRLAMLMTNHREPIDFTKKRLEEAEKNLNRWKTTMLKLGLHFCEENREEYQALGPCSKLLALLANDLNMSGVLAELHRHAGGDREHNARRLFGSLQLLGLVTFDGMKAFEEAQGAAPSHKNADEIEAKIAARLDHLNAKEWGEADAIRDELAAMGVKLKDGKDDAGNRITNWEVC